VHVVTGLGERHGAGQADDAGADDDDAHIRTLSAPFTSSAHVDAPSYRPTVTELLYSFTLVTSVTRLNLCTCL
jgi:hypothetical protein